MERNITPDVRRVRKCLAAGGDPLTLGIGGGPCLNTFFSCSATHFPSVYLVFHFTFYDVMNFRKTDTQIEIAWAFGPECSWKAVEGHFSRTKKLAARLRDCRDSGGDPMALDLGDKRQHALLF